MEKLSHKDTARLLNISPQTLYNWRVQGFGPPYYKIRKKVLYDKRDVLEFIEKNKKEIMHEN